MWDHDPDTLSPVLGKFLDDWSITGDSKLMLQLLDSHSVPGHDHCFEIAFTSC